jgi:hypothetical protein
MNRMMRPAAHVVFAGGDMNLLDHSVLEVPSGGFSWVVEKGVRASCLISILADWSEFF